MASVVITISCSDPTGAVGIETDIKTFQSLSLFSTGITTEVISIDEDGKYRTEHRIHAATVKKLLDSVHDKYNISAIKIGYISDVAVLEMLADYDFKSPVLFDPIMLSCNQLASADIQQSIRKLIQKCVFTCLSTSEVNLLYNTELKSLKDLDYDSLPDELRLCPNILIHATTQTGTDGSENENITDVFLNNCNISTVFNGHYEIRDCNQIRSTKSSALLAFLSDNLDCETSVIRAFSYLEGLTLSNDGPVANIHLNHGWLTSTRAVPLPTAKTPFPFTNILFARAGKIWDDYINHPVCQQIALGTLPMQGFCNYLCQDYHYLGNYARLHGLAIYKGRLSPVEELKGNSVILSAIASEMDNHLTMCENFGIQKQIVLGSQEDFVNTAYSRYILDVGASGSLLELKVAAYSCLIGYGYMGRIMYQKAVESNTIEDNPFKRWLAQYSGGEFWNAVETGRDLIETLITKEAIGSVQLERLVDIFIQTTKFEISFFNLALLPSSTP
ncbi:hypothetical protein V1511DRAFT_493613 [Dipodascopsis uninucleata]